MATLHILHPKSPPLAGFLRLGHTGHRKLAELLASGRFPYKRVVVDAAYFGDQIDLIKSLKADGCEIVLDPNFAEMATARFNSSTLQKLAWSNADRPWVIDDFQTRRNHDAVRAIARFAVKNGVHAILAPSHFIELNQQAWRPVDLRLCEALRHELDQAGGTEIEIDYQLITTPSLLREQSLRDEVASDLAGLPISNVWVRVSGFGATATGAGTRALIENIRGLHQMSKPLILDMAGGFSALSTMALGASSGISHGIGRKEKFYANEWNKPPGRGGVPARTYVPELDRHFTEAQLASIYAARGGRSRFSCNDSSCCPSGAEDMFENAHAHFIIQRHRQIEDISRTPELRRSEQFLLKHLDPAIRTARFGASLKIEDAKVAAAVKEAKGRLIRLRDALADLDSKGQPDTRARPISFRGGSMGLSAVLGS